MEDLFMNSRDRLRDIPLRNEIESTLEEMISNHPGLRALREKRRREEISNSLDNSKPLKEALEKIIKKSPSLASLFSPGKEGLHSPFDLRGVEKQDEFKGRTFPKYFKLISNPYKRVPKNHRFRMQYETDASNDYFDRLEFSGEFFLRLEGKESQEFILNLWNGIANLTMSIPEDAEVGDILKYTTEVKDKDQLEPFTSEFQIEVLEPAIPSKGISGDRVAPPSSNKGEDRSVPTQLELPQVTEVYKKDWGDEYDDYTALKIQQAEENSYDFYVNMDNRYMLAEIKSRSRDDPQILKAQFKFALVLVGLGILFDQRKHSNGTTNDETLLDEIEKITRGVAAVLLPMLNDLSALIPEDE